MSKENKPALYVGPHNEPMFQDEDGVPFEREDVTNPFDDDYGRHGGPLDPEPGSLMDREGIAYNRESYFR
jgi:hypothetical protein